MKLKMLRVSATILTVLSAFSPSALAATTTTTLGIANEAPTFHISGIPSDNGSDGTTPTNAGSNVTFTAIARDTNGDQWYLAMCKTDAVTAGNNAAPTCPGGSWAISGANNTGVESSITYATATAGEAESNDWYAFACDKISGVGLCSASHQGTASPSPFKVNHRPSIGTVTAGSSYGSNASVDPGSVGTLFKITTAIGSGADTGKAVALQSDGKLVVAGASHNGTNYGFAVARYSTDGTLDTSFSGDGKVTTNIFAVDDLATAVVIQSDGKIVVAGYAWNGSDYDFALARYTTEGVLDTGFDTDGKVTTNFVSGTDKAYSVAIQGDGKIVVAGEAATAFASDFAVARYNTDGSLDTTFDTDGKVTTDIAGSSSGYANSVAIQSTGEIVAAGWFINGSSHNFALVRYTSTGALDTTFDTDGKVITAIGAGLRDYAYSVAIQSDGKIVAAGASDMNPLYAFSTVRYNSNGSLDTDFGTGGKVTTVIGTDDYIQSIALQSDGKIVASGYSYNGSNYDFALVRYTTAGALDTAFDTDGKVTTAIGSGAEQSYSVAIQSNGKIVSAGYSHNGTNNDFALVRYTTAGAVDSSGGGGDVYVRTVVTDSDTDTAADTISMHVCSTNSFVAGACAATTLCSVSGVASGANAECTITTAVPTPTAHGSYPIYVFLKDSHGFTDIGTSNTQSYSVTDTAPYISDSNAYTVSAITLSAAASTAKSYSVTVKDDNGDNDIVSVEGTLYDTVALNTLFGTGGKVTTDFGVSDGAYASALQGDGKIVVAGGVGGDFGLARYTTAGVLDTTFDTDGKVTTSLGASGEVITSLALQSDGKIVGAGYMNNGANWDFALARYNTDGSLDTTFSGDGMLTTAIMDGNDFATGIAIQADGKIVVAGYGHNGSNDDFFLVRYTATGDLDTTFDGDPAMPGYPGNGKLSTRVGVGWSYGYSVAIQADGKILVAGNAYNGVADGGNTDFALARYNTDGTLDTTFDTDGKVITPIGSGNESAQSIIVGADGKIVAVGYSHNGTNNDFAVSRYSANGSLDTGFSTDGKLTTVIGSGDDLAYGAALQTDGMIVAAGYSHNGANNDFALARYTTTGVLDTAFSADGKVTTAIGAGAEQANSIAIQSDGKIVAAGYSSNGVNDDFALVRYKTDGSLSDTTGLVLGTCTADENDCYSGVTCTLGDVGSGTDISATATCGFTVWFNANYSTSWKLHANPADESGAVTTQADSAAIATNAVQSIDVPEGTIAYGTVALGAASSGVAITLQNMGNQTLDLLVQGTAMSRTGGGGSIAASQQKWHNRLQDFTYSGDGNTLVTDSSSATTKAAGCADRGLAVRDAHASGTGYDESLYLKLQIPSSQTAGSYTGTNTLAAAASTTCADGE